MWAGRLLAREMQNPNTLDKAAQNVLLMNAFIQRLVLAITKPVTMFVITIK